MNYLMIIPAGGGFTRGLLSQTTGTPSIEDLWYFIPLALAISISVILVFHLKRKKSDHTWIFGSLAVLLFFGMIFLYDPFLAMKAKSVLKAVFSVWLILSSVIFGIFSLNILYLYCFWNYLTIRRRIYSAINGIASFAMSFATLYLAFNL